MTSPDVPVHRPEHQATWYRRTEVTLADYQRQALIETDWVHQIIEGAHTVLPSQLRSVLLIIFFFNIFLALVVVIIWLSYEAPSEEYYYAVHDPDNRDHQE